MSAMRASTNPSRENTSRAARTSVSSVRRPFGVGGTGGRGGIATIVALPLVLAAAAGRFLAPTGPRPATTHPTPRLRDSPRQLEQVPVIRPSPHLLSGFLQDDAPGAHYVRAVGDPQRLDDILLQQQHGQAVLVGEPTHAVEDLGDQRRCET